MRSNSLVGKWEVVAKGDLTYLHATDPLNRRQYIFTKSGLVKGFGFGNEWEKVQYEHDGISVEFEGMWIKTLVRFVSDLEVHFSRTGLNGIEVLKRCAPELPNAAFLIFPPSTELKQEKQIVANINADFAIMENEYEPELLGAHRVFCLWLNGRLSLIVCHNQRDVLSKIAGSTRSVFDSTWGNRDAKLLTKRFYSLSLTDNSYPLLNDFTGAPRDTLPVTFNHVNGVSEVILVVVCDESFEGDVLKDVVSSTGLFLISTEVEREQSVEKWLRSNDLLPAMVYAFATPPEDILIAIAKVILSLVLIRMRDSHSISMHLLWDFGVIPCQIRPSFAR